MRPDSADSSFDGWGDGSRKRSKIAGSTATPNPSGAGEAAKDAAPVDNAGGPCCTMLMGLLGVGLGVVPRVLGEGACCEYNDPRFGVCWTYCVVWRGVARRGSVATSCGDAVSSGGCGASALCAAVCEYPVSATRRCAGARLGVEVGGVGGHAPASRQLLC